MRSIAEAGLVFCREWCLRLQNRVANVLRDDLRAAAVFGLTELQKSRSDLCFLRVEHVRVLVLYVVLVEHRTQGVSLCAEKQVWSGVQ